MRDIMTDKRNKWLAQHMKQQDILPGHRTEGLYVPARKTMAGKAGGNVCICAECAGKCTVGRLLLERRAT